MTEIRWYLVTPRHRLSEPSRWFVLFVDGRVAVSTNEFIEVGETIFAVKRCCEANEWGFAPAPEVKV